MAITTSRYSQFKDYLTQLINLSKKEGLPRITQEVIGEKLNVDPSGVSRFLSGETARPKRMMTHFKDRYVQEFERWPATANKIERILQAGDIWYFWNLGNFTPLAAAPLSKVPSSIPLPPSNVPLPSPVKSEPIAPRPGEMVRGLPSPVPLPPFHLPLPPLVKSEPIAPRPGEMIRGLPSPIPLPIPYLPLPPLVKSETISVSLLEQRGESSAAGARRELSMLALVRAAICNEKTRGCPVAPIAISYRGHESTQDAAGMIFDHMRFQTVTETPTQALMPEGEEPRQACRTLFFGALRQHPAQLPHGIDHERATRHPPLVETAADAGLLVIPGRVHKIENEPIRLRHEYRVIREALNRGQPILGICAGSWRVWEQLKMWTLGPDYMGTDAVQLVDWHAQNHTLVDVTDHTYHGGMIRLGSMGVRAAYNVALHDVVFEENSLVKAAMRIEKNRTRVNSVHWKAVNPVSLPLNTKISGYSRVNSEIEINSRQGNLMVPEANAAEAFENIAGAPILGIQWHPEGYNPDDQDSASQGNLLRYMALAGKAYAAKRRMLREISSQ